MKIIIDGEEFEFESFLFYPHLHHVYLDRTNLLMNIEIAGYTFLGEDEHGVFHKHHLRDLYVDYDENGDARVISFRTSNIPIEKWD